MIRDAARTVAAVAVATMVVVWAVVREARKPVIAGRRPRTGPPR